MYKTFLVEMSIVRQKKSIFEIFIYFLVTKYTCPFWW